MRVKHVILGSMKKLLHFTPIFIFGILSIYQPAYSEYHVHIPNRVGDGPIGIFLTADYEEYPDPIDIEFSKKQPGNDWRSVLANYYHSIYTQDKDAFRQLYTDKDGDFSSVNRSLNKGSSWGANVKVDKVQLFKAFRQGKLIIPGLKIDITPEFAGLDSVIFCEDEKCHLAQDFNLLYMSRVLWSFYNSLDGQFSSQANGPELDEFHRTKQEFIHYFLKPSNPSHRSSEDPNLTPSVYLNIKRYPKRWRFALNKKANKNLNPPADIAPILGLFSNIKTLTFNQLRKSKDLYDAMYVKAFRNENILNRPLPLFNERTSGFQNESSTTGVYTDRVWHWDAIVPVGYLDHGSARYIYFYPETDDYPLTSEGQPMIQVLPVRLGKEGYYLSPDILIGTRLGSLQFPEAIAVVMDYFDPNVPAVDFGKGDNLVFGQEQVKPQIQDNPLDKPIDEKSANSQKAIFIFIVLLLVIAGGVWFMQKQRAKKLN